MFYTCIQETLGSNLGLDIGRPDTFVAFLRPSWQMPGYYLDLATTAAFQIYSNSSIILPLDTVLSICWQRLKTTHKNDGLSRRHANTITWWVMILSDEEFLQLRMRWEDGHQWWANSSHILKDAAVAYFMVPFRHAYEERKNTVVAANISLMSKYQSFK
jgi:hypothetical protein